MRAGLPVISGVALALTLAACSAPDRTPQIPTGTSVATTAPAASTTKCTPGAKASYRPADSLPQPNRMPAGTLMAAIQRRGYLLVGTSSDTRLLSTRNASGQFQGFDVEVAQRVARAI